MRRALSRKAFEKLVADALDDLPQELAGRMRNVELVIEDRPDRDTAAELDGDPRDLLGLYRGIPLTERGNDYSGVLPDRIALYQRNIERAADSVGDVREVVRRTVIHEIAHHFGIDDDRLEELGWA